MLHGGQKEAVLRAFSECLAAFQQSSVRVMSANVLNTPQLLAQFCGKLQLYMNAVGKYLFSSQQPSEKERQELVLVERRFSETLVHAYSGVQRANGLREKPLPAPKIFAE